MASRLALILVGGIGLLAGCARVDKAKAEVYLAAVETYAEHTLTSGEAMCQRTKQPDRGQRLAREVKERSRELRRSSDAALEALMQSQPPAAFRERLKPLHGASAALHQKAALLALSCDVGEPSATTPQAREELQRAHVQLREAVALLRSSL